MYIQSLLSVALLAFSTVACESGEFSGAESATQAYSVTIKDTVPGEDSTAETVKVPETDAAPVEGTEKGNGKGKDPIKGVEGSEQADCAQLSGIKIENVKINGSEQNIVITKHDALAFRVTGNKNVLSIDLKNQAVESHVQAICVFVAGNQNQVKIEVANHVGAIYIVARGNQPQINIAALKGSVIDKIDFDSKGNAGKISVQGEGKYSCDKSDPNMTCS